MFNLAWFIPVCRYSSCFHTLDSPSAWEEINFNKWVGVAVVVPWDKVSGLQDVNDQVAKLLVIVDLKLKRETEFP